MEMWKDIKGYEGVYKVSDFGRVKSLSRADSANRKRLGSIRSIAVNGRGYSCLTLCKDGKNKSFNIHQLVAIAFLNHSLCGHEIVVDHIDNDKSNNHLNNLQLITNRKNCSKDKKGGSSRYTGVSFDSKINKWVARIYIDNKYKFIGSFLSEKEAAAAYNNALKQIK